MKVLRFGIFITLDVLLFFSLLFSSIQVIVYSKTYFQWHYEQHEIEEETGMDIGELMRVTDLMMDYLIDQRESLDMMAIIDGQEEEVFGEREKLHMVDVKELFLIAKKIRDIGAILIVSFVIISSLLFSKELKAWLIQLKVFFVSSIVILALLGGLFISDFTKYFTIFHEIFFHNDLWLLDPRTDILINMVPEVFFFQTVLLILMSFGFSIFVTFLLRKWGIKRIKSGGELCSKE